MRTSTPHDRSYTLITGCTGFLGRYLLASLLRRGARCVAAVRAPSVDAAAARVRRALEDVGLHADGLAPGALLAAPIDLSDPGSRWHLPDVPLSSVVHAAAVTRFTADAHGEPHRTNVDGTRRLLDLCATRDVRQVHLLSTAYVCGRERGPIREEVETIDPGFHNDYERSKWLAESLALAWARGGDGRSLTVYRPSVVVGEFASGRTSKFDGFYLSVRATELLARSMEGEDCDRRHHVRLRIAGRPGDCQNIVPVDYVAAAVATGVLTPALHGRVYHLTNPRPPTNQQIKQALERYFDLGGGRFVEPTDFDSGELSESERLFSDVSRPIRHYLIDTPTFLRDHTATLESRAGLTCPAYDEAALTRLVHYAVRSGWGRKRVAPEPATDTEHRVVYFERFLPRHIDRSEVAQATAMTVTIRFVVGGDIEGGSHDKADRTEYVCRFVRGRLVEVRRDAHDVREDFGYRATTEAFWHAVSGRADPQDLFLSGGAEVFGDVEKALKMGVILHAFNRQFPCDPHVLRTLGGAA
jgi:nucleoside-diphosphate-sugar epimerase